MIDDPYSSAPRDRPLDDAYRALLEASGEADLPSSALDARIRLAAAQAVEAQSVRQAGLRPRWQVSVALAATIVLAVGLLIEQREVEEVRSLSEPMLAPEALPAASEREQAQLRSLFEKSEKGESVPATASDEQRPTPAANDALNDAAGVAQQAPAQREHAPPPTFPAAQRLEVESARKDDTQAATPRSVEADSPHAAMLAEIRALRAAGKIAAAAERLAQFRRLYPDTAVPADLR